VRTQWLPPFHVRSFRPEEVTSRNVAAEVDPRQAGMTQADVDTIWESVVSLYKGGLHPAIGLCVRKNGHVVIDRAIGHERGNAPGAKKSDPKVPIRHDSLFNLFSASKSITAMVIHLLDERGLLHLDDAVAEYIPEFGRNGKEGVTIRQLLTHRAGIPTVRDAPFELDLLADWDRILTILCQTKPLSVPGRRLAYHALTSGYVLGEVVRRVTGRDLRKVLREEILNPLGFRSFDYGVAPERIGEVAENAFTGMPSMPPQSWLLKRALGMSVNEATEASNDARFLTAIIPSGNIIGTAEEASRFYQLLLDEGELGGVRIFDPRTVRRAIAEQSYLELDSFLGFPVRYGMGFVLGAPTFSLYGPDTENAFGHVGFTAVLSWADRDRKLSVGLMTSGKPFITPGQIAWLQVARTIAKVVPRA
jgi:CubicO group peptidase (beta-lactamase class C family)